MGIFSINSIEDMPMDELEFASEDFDRNVYRPTKDEIISKLQHVRTNLSQQNLQLSQRIVVLENQINNNPFIALEKRMNIIEKDLSEINGKKYGE